MKTKKVNFIKKISLSLLASSIAFTSIPSHAFGRSELFPTSPYRDYQYRSYENLDQYKTA